MSLTRETGVSAVWKSGQLADVDDRHPAATTGSRARDLRTSAVPTICAVGSVGIGALHHGAQQHVAAAPRSSLVAFSISLWLMPSSQGMKIMPVGATRLM